MKTLYLSPPSFDGFDGGAGARYQARREVTSYWYPTWLAQPAALTPDSRLLDCPPHRIGMEECLNVAERHDHVILHTSTPPCSPPKPSRHRRPSIGLAARSSISPARKLPRAAPSTASTDSPIATPK